MLIYGVWIGHDVILRILYNIYNIICLLHAALLLYIHILLHHGYSICISFKHYN